MHQPFDMDPEVASTIITIIGSFLVAWLTSTYKAKRRKPATNTSCPKRSRRSRSAPAGCMMSSSKSRTGSTPNT